MSASTPASGIHGLMAEFETATALVVAANRTREAGYVDVDAYSPIPIEELHHAIGFKSTKLPLMVLIGGLLGGTGGFSLQYWVSAIAYPLNIGGKPYVSWPMFIPVTFECTILGAALTCVFGMIMLNKLPMPYHPVFNNPRFAMASRNRFFLCIEATDQQFDLERTRAFMATLGAHEVTTVAE
ncbi:MAG TPA: DUF3341 domain-containing protein [Vicinamibacterales bacterium]|nr:DUF3341 domain-containing protein [Vicinamibacterales bacterium]